MTEHRPWFSSYPKGIPRSLEPYPEVSVFSLLEGAARRFPDRPATAWFGARMSYRELLAAAERFSENEPFRKAGLFSSVKVSRMRRGQWNPAAAPKSAEGN